MNQLLEVTPPPRGNTTCWIRARAAQADGAASDTSSAAYCLQDLEQMS